MSRAIFIFFSFYLIKLWDGLNDMLDDMLDDMGVDVE